MLLFEGIDFGDLVSEGTWLKLRTLTPTNRVVIAWHREGRFCTSTAASLRASGLTVTSSSRALTDGSLQGVSVP